MRWATYERAGTTCSGKAMPGAVALMEWLVANVADAESLGIYNCRPVRGGSAPSTHGEGRALDLGLPLAPDGTGTPAGHDVVTRLGEVGDQLGVQAVIYDRLMWSARSPSGRDYGGVSPHYDHLHIELTRHAAATLTAQDVADLLGGPIMGPKDIAYFQRALKAAAMAHGNPAFDPGKDDGSIGEVTTKALKAWQKARSIEQTGTITLATVSTLDRDWSKGLVREAGDHEHTITVTLVD